MDITFKLEVFEGPLDLLLHLISQNKVSIDDIPISMILEQYLDYLEQLSSLNIEFTSDFIVMAAQLILIKSKMLLPQDEQEEEDPRLDLARRLAEYKLFKEAAVWLSSGRKPSASSIKQPEPQDGPAPYMYAHDKSELLRAMLSLFEKEVLKRPPPVSAFTGVVRKEFESVEQAARRVIELLTKRGKMRLMDMLVGMGNRSAAIAAFLALLDLCKENKVLLDENNFVDINS